MDLKIAARMIAVLAIGAAMSVALMALRENGVEDAPASPLQIPGGEPRHLSPEEGGLARCRDLGMAAAGDAACREAWAESRRRFLGQHPRDARP